MKIKITPSDIKRLIESDYERKKSSTMKIEITLSDIWRLLEPDYRYIAQDKSGSWYAYKEKPRMVENKWLDTDDKDPWSPCYNYIRISVIGVENPNWINTLQERPKN